MRTIINTMFKVDETKYTQDEIEGVVGAMVVALDFIIPQKGTIKELLDVAEKVRGIFNNSSNFVISADNTHFIMTVEYQGNSLYWTIKHFYELKNSYEKLLYEGLRDEQLGDCRLILYLSMVAG